MEELKNWISGICAVTLMISVIKSLLPENLVGKIFNLTAALILIFTVISPIKKLGFDRFDLELRQNKEAISEMIQKVTAENAKITDDIIEHKLCEYICNKSDLCEEDIKITCNDGNVVSVQLNKKDDNAMQIIKADCGISEDKIERRW